jgi:uncharacterized delta-60 repeat protein
VVAKGIVSVVAAFLALPALALAAPGELDPMYGDGGVFRTPGPGTRGLALAPNGDAVIAGAGGLDEAPDLSHMRVTPSGVAAPGYEAGRVRTVFEPYHHTTVNAVTTDAAGRVVIGGSVRNRGASDYDAYVFARYLPDGRPDPSFGTAGVVILELQEKVERVADVAVDSAGRIVFTSARAYDPVVGRLTPDGRLDPTFAGGWLRLEDLVGVSGCPCAFALLPDGGLAVLGAVGIKPAVVRLTPDGAPDPAFGDGGVVVIDDDATPSWPSVGVWNIAPAPGGGFVLSGDADVRGEHEERLWALRLHADGSVDPTFGGPIGASVHVPIPPRSEEGYPSYLEAAAADVAVQADGRVVLAGWFQEEGAGGTDQHGVLARLLPDGALDRTFGRDGLTIVRNGHYGFSDVVIQRDGRILAATPGAFDIVRFQGDGAPAGGPPARRETSATPRGRATVHRRGRVRLRVPCAHRRCVVRLRIGHKVVAKRRAVHVRRVAVRLPRRIVRRLDRRGELTARLVIRYGKRRIVRRVSLLPSGAP